MLIRKPDDIKSWEITDEKVYHQRRQFLKGAGLLAASAMLPAASWAADRQVLAYDGDVDYSQRPPAWLKKQLTDAKPGGFSTTEKVTPYQYVTEYNNFYEFGTDKDDPHRNASNFVTDPWHVEVAGEAEITGKFTLEDILKPHHFEERIYRLRCVEAWSMVVPWIGFPLADLLKRFRPTSGAKFVRFETLYDPSQMPGQRSSFSAIQYPYVEGLRIDEAMNELAFMATGLYGRELPPQNGAPLRLVVPWKYGFKSIKSIVRIEFTEAQPRTTWERTNSREYGFYANVNPDVDHPRWSQATERRLPSSLFSPNRIDTRMFNGYGEQVAHLYSDMDLRKYY
ncbi:MAG: protein-methionine-sulfoxide reductase catalytic subunit MsrP [Pseudomonadales bacterium]|nr:protein-methionine-sulfoxide reductase catalytic subunit MsrP [Pseudomonadales bacterium]